MLQYVFTIEHTLQSGELPPSETRLQEKPGSGLDIDTHTTETHHAKTTTPVIDTPAQERQIKILSWSGVHWHAASS